MLNLSVFTGRIVNELELTTSGDSKYVRFRVAVRRDYKNANDEYDSDFIPCICWGQLADLVHQRLKKGSRITVKDGSLRSGRYEKDGQTNYTLEVHVKAIDFLDPLEKPNQVNYQFTQDPFEGN